MLGGMIQAQRPVAIARVAATTRVAAFTALEAKKKGKGGGNNDGAQPRERKEKDDVIEVGQNLVARRRVPKHTHRFWSKAW